MPQIEISQEAFAFLQSRAVPFTDTPAEVLDRLLSMLPASSVTEVDKASPVPILHAMDELPRWRDIALQNVRLDDRQISLRDWRELLLHLLKMGEEKDISAVEVLSDVGAVWFDEESWHLPSEMDIRNGVLAMTENEIRATIADLVPRLNVRLECLLSWYEDDYQENLDQAKLILGQAA